MTGLLLCVLYLAVALGRVDIDIVRPPPRNLSSDCEVDNPILSPEPWREWNRLTSTIEGILKGNKTPLLEQFGSVYDIFATYNYFCDFFPTKEPGAEDVEYVPGACVTYEQCIDSAHFEYSEWSQRSCWEAVENTHDGDDDYTPAVIRNYICCPLNGTWQWQRLKLRYGLPNAVTQRHETFKELPGNFQLEPTSTYVHVSGRNVDFMSYEALVCGFARGEYMGDKVQENGQGSRRMYAWYPYFCVKPDQCGKAKEKGTPLPEANPLWHQFCQPRFTPEDNPNRDVSGEPRYIFPMSELHLKTHCCHVHDVGELFLKARRGSYVAIPQLPTFLRFAPGLRSVYKCEEYGKKICEIDPDGENNCIDAAFDPPRAGENPHMASLGIVVPNMMVFHCGGALVSLRYILSAATCRHYSGHEVNIVMLGEHSTSIYESGKERFYVIIDIVQMSGFPPAFRPNPLQDERTRTESDFIDLALYKTEVEVEFTRYIRPICLWHGHRAWPKHPHFLGWGSREEYRSMYLDTLMMLKETQLCTSDKFFTDSPENPYYGRYGANNDWMFCLKNGEGSTPPEGHSNPCTVDLGGPLQETLASPYCTKLLLGILSSRNTDTNLLKPSVFINTSNFLGAIEDELWGSNIFIDLLSDKFKAPSCGHPQREDYFFFNKCEGGQDCDGIHSQL